MVTRQLICNIEIFSLLPCSVFEFYMLFCIGKLCNFHALGSFFGFTERGRETPVVLGYSSPLCQGRRIKQTHCHVPKVNALNSAWGVQNSLHLSQD
jgi:hypothetical protein